MARIRMNPEARYKQMLAAGVKIALESDIKNVKRHNVCEACGCSDGMVNKYFGGIENMRNAILCEISSKPMM